MAAAVLPAQFETHGPPIASKRLGRGSPPAATSLLPIRSWAAKKIRMPRTAIPATPMDTEKHLVSLVGGTAPLIVS